MKQRYCLAIVLLTILLAIMMSGCSKNNVSDSSEGLATIEIATNETEYETRDNAADTTLIQEENSINGIDKDRVKEDLINEGLNIQYINYGEIVLEIDSLEIVRGKETEDGTELHVDVNLSNEFYVVKIEYSLFYTYYDIGGWYLDDYNITNYLIYAVDNPVTDNDFCNMMLDHFDSCSIIDRTKELDEENVYHDYITFSATIDYEYVSVQFEGECVYEFFDGIWQMYDNL